jgi:Ca2+-binding RTX toxin-like protein
MRKLGGVLTVSLVALAAPVAASASTPGTNGAILFTQPRCPAWVGFRCDAPPQPCAIDRVTGHSFVPDLPLEALLSPDGGRIAWTAIRDGVERLLVANADGSDERALADADPVGSMPAWSPDGSKIAFEGASATNPTPLEVVDLGSAAISRLVSGVFDQSWAPDGSEIAVEAFDAHVRPVIGAVDPRDGSLRFVTGELDTPDQPVDSGPDWSPDSSQIAFTHGAFGVPPEVQAVARDGSGRRDVTQGEDPTWSPDGSQLAFVRGGGVWTSALDGSRESRLAWVPDVVATRPRWLTKTQTSALRPVGSCDTDVSENDAEYRGGEGIDTFVVTGVRVGVFGNGGDDFFFVGHPDEPGPTFLDGGAGSDDFELFGSANTVNGGPGKDHVDAVLDGDPQHLSGGPGNDWIRGGYGNDTIDGGPGNDALCGVDGVNTIHGGAGNDVVSAYSGSQAQRLFGDAGSDLLVGGAGPDLLVGGLRRDRIIGHAGADVVYARDGARDSIECGAGRDTVYADRLDVVARSCERVVRSR